MEASEYIEKGLGQNLSKAEQENYKSKISTDPDFAKQVKEESYLLNALDEIKSQELKLHMDKLEKGIDSENTTQSSTHPLLKWAAVFAFLAMASTWFLFNATHSSQDLFASYYTVYPNVENPVVRSAANQQGAWRLYSSGNYEDAYQQFQYSLSNGNTNEAGWFYLGICAIELDRFNQAEEAFNKVLTMKDGRYQEQAKWYLALNYLKADKLGQAKNMLLQINKSTSTYAPKAGELLNELM